MCAYCFAALGTVVGGVALAKAGALAAAKVALVGFVMQHFLMRR
jgi:hypothetical protein